MAESLEEAAVALLYSVVLRRLVQFGNGDQRIIIDILLMQGNVSLQRCAPVEQ